MRTVKLLCLIAMICSAGLTSGEQKKPPVQGHPGANVTPRQAEQNKVPVRQLYEEMFSHGRYELQNQVFASRCPVHFGGRNVRLEGAVAEGKGWRSAAPDLRMTINEITVKGDMVTAVWTATGTNTGHGHGLKPTGRRISLHGRSQFRVANGKIVEAWNEEYRDELFKQLGVPKPIAMLFEAADNLVSAISWALPDRLYYAFR
jgi:predicted ester cyclase